MTTAQDLTKFAKEALNGRQFVAAIQREPYLHVHTPEGIKAQKSIGGASAVLLDTIFRATGGTLVAWAAGDADQEVVDSQNRVKIPPGEEKYTLKRLFLTKKEMDKWYYGMANQTLWPLSHTVFVKPTFRESWWRSYVKINWRYTQAILEEVKDENAFVWVHDYHLALVPKMLREQRPKLSIGIFWHIPWPTAEMFRICPWRHEILEGLLGADLVGFHRHYHVENFIDCLREEIGVIVESEPRSVLYKKRLTKIMHLPAGIDAEEIDDKLRGQPQISSDKMAEELGLNLHSPYLILGVDRFDYTKGFVERLRILDRFFEKYPQYQHRVTHVAIAVPSRISIPAYKAYNSKVHKLIDRINTKYQKNGWKPIHLIEQGIDRDRLFNYYRAADVGLVTPLDDGMNLVAKEFAIGCQPDKGMLVLSRFTGASKDLYASLLINPYDTEGAADAVHEALIMKPEEKLRRNMEMRRVLEENNIYKWGIDFIKNATTENLTHQYL
jgi:trehalose-6-phosphate synthase